MRDIIHNGASGEAAPAKSFIEVDFDIFLFTFCVEHIEMCPVTALSVMRKNITGLISIQAG